MLWLVLIAVHDQCHADGEHEHFTVTNMLCVASFYQHIIKAFKGSRDHVKCQLAATRFVLKQNGEAADETRDQHVPSIDLLPIVLREAQQVAEDSNVYSEEQRRLDDVFERLPKGFFGSRECQHKRDLLLNDLLAFKNDHRKQVQRTVELVCHVEYRAEFQQSVPATAMIMDVLALEKPAVVNEVSQLRCNLLDHFVIKAN